MKKSKKIVIAIVVIAFLLSTPVIWFFWSQTTVVKLDSPDGSYQIKYSSTDMGGAGYYGKIYLIDKRGFFDKKYFTGQWVPAIVTWVSDNEFSIYSKDGSHKFLVSQFIKE